MVWFVQPCVGVIGLKWQVKWQTSLSKTLPTKRNGNIHRIVLASFLLFWQVQMSKNLPKKCRSEITFYVEVFVQTQYKSHTYRYCCSTFSLVCTYSYMAILLKYCCCTFFVKTAVTHHFRRRRKVLLKYCCCTFFVKTAVTHHFGRRRKVFPGFCRALTYFAGFPERAPLRYVVGLKPRGCWKLKMG